MRALGPRLVCRKLGVWQILFCLAVLAYVGRAFIPADYMPASASHSKGFAITFCTASHSTPTLWIDLPDQEGQADPDTPHPEQDCPFGMAVSAALLPALDAPALHNLMRYRAVLLDDTHRAWSPLLEQGPPLGSRAPPF